jgi:hypothetical protein
MVRGGIRTRLHATLHQLFQHTAPSMTEEPSTMEEPQQAPATAKNPICIFIHTTCCMNGRTWRHFGGGYFEL